mmetsp:Transcript_17358/g.20435  ORF Transcript_17358/g.20435 Transcript_17358/m.20435 type:complete len:228 (+) Transcript_17358:93-776(+)|eukprot:CAMPEP_0114359912 /NCGR_PEP_ID=MMETSP0101-20121206/23396_1 /TAXON_ID=38822 ORGANISM="Pteridomonas danica, Strain PT" /NCGR_SAMPLE_ID=MMETSP0101 /ASSEMBLY_ACC=CAM_ASM_000211 /LENGTH=227 /DNA_ID=CAMNT_0001503739 /DNA_START=39 /DNA_END=722 /DNA_ORIENTATION=+
MSYEMFAKTGSFGNSSREYLKLWLQHVISLKISINKVSINNIQALVEKYIEELSPDVIQQPLSKIEINSHMFVAFVKQFPEIKYDRMRSRNVTFYSLNFPPPSSDILKQNYQNSDEPSLEDKLSKDILTQRIRALIQIMIKNGYGDVKLKDVSNDLILHYTLDDKTLGKTRKFDLDNCMNRESIFDENVVDAGIPTPKRARATMKEQTQPNKSNYTSDDMQPKVLIN